MDATALIITEFESDALEYERRLSEVGFATVVTSCGEEPLRVYLDARPELVVLDLLSVEDECSILGSIHVGGWRNVHVPVVVVGEDADTERYLDAGAQVVVRQGEVEETLAIAAMAAYAERCRRLLERSSQERDKRSTVLLSA